MDEKVKIRSKCLKIRNNLSGEDCVSKSKQIAERLESLDVFIKAQHVLFYYTHNKEADTVGLIEDYIDSKQLYLPVVHGKSSFQAVPINSPLKLQKGFEGVPEPVDEEPSSVYDNRVECVITPGVAFDKKGNRLGTGKGYYDRYFQKNKGSVKIGLAYEEQVLDYVPKDAYDESVDIIVTDQDVYYCNPNYSSKS